MQTELIGKKRLIGDIWQFEFTKPPNFSFIAGDFCELELGNKAHGGARWLTIASAPYEQLLRFVTKIPVQPSVFKQCLRDLQPGQKAWLSPALGMFHLPREHDKPLLFLAAGLGITPYMSMLHQIRSDTQAYNIELLYWAKSDQHLDLAGVNPAKKVTTSEVTFDLTGVEQLAPDWRAKTIYLSGPEPLCLKLYQAMRAADLPQHQIKLDYFEGYFEI